MSSIGRLVIIVLVVAVVAVVLGLKLGGRTPRRVLEAEIPPVDTTSARSDEVVPSGLEREPTPAHSEDESGLPRLVDFGSEGCIPCIRMAVVMEELARDYAEKLSLEVVDVRVDEERAREEGIRLIPTQVFYDPSGKELYRHLGFMSKEDILAKWAELGFDLDAKPRSKAE